MILLENLITLKVFVKEELKERIKLCENVLKDKEWCLRKMQRKEIFLAQISHTSCVKSLMSIMTRLQTHGDA